MILTKVMAFIGWCVTLLALAGALGIGDFRLYYGHKVDCIVVRK